MHGVYQQKPQPGEGKTVSGSALLGRLLLTSGCASGVGLVMYTVVAVVISLLLLTLTGCQAMPGAAAPAGEIVGGVTTVVSGNPAVGAAATTLWNWLGTLFGISDPQAASALTGAGYAAASAPLARAAVAIGKTGEKAMFDALQKRHA